MNNPSAKPVYSCGQYSAAFINIMVRLPAMLAVRRHHPIDRAFAERVMLACTSVNRCRYCAWFHGGLAKRVGMDDDEIAAILSAEMETNIPDDQVQAILFAREYAQNRGKPSQEAVAKLKQNYGVDKAKAILLYLRFITYGNLTGNTFDASRDRLRGQTKANVNLPFALVFFALHAAILLPQLTQMRTRKRAFWDKSKEDFVG